MRLPNLGRFLLGALRLTPKHRPIVRMGLQVIFGAWAAEKVNAFLFVHLSRLQFGKLKGKQVEKCNKRESESLCASKEFISEFIDLLRCQRLRGKALLKPYLFIRILIIFQFIPKIQYVLVTICHICELLAASLPSAH